MALSPGKQLIMLEEKERHGCAPHQRAWASTMLGPLLIHYGTKEQQDHYLPKILAGEHIWCQGYSEPNAGSDLASLRTEAVLDGDDWVVNGQKIWTSLAMDANWIFLLVRTDKQAKKQDGISFLLVPMDSAGHHGPADHQHRYGRRVLRDVLRQRARAEGEPGRRDQQGLDDGEEPAGLRAHRIGSPAPVLLCADAAELLADDGRLGRRASSRTATPGCGWISRTSRRCTTTCRQG